MMMMMMADDDNDNIKLNSRLPKNFKFMIWRLRLLTSVSNMKPNKIIEQFRERGNGSITDNNKKVIHLPNPKLKSISAKIEYVI